MKILLCKSHFADPVSGSDETLVSYATHLHKQGHSPTVVLLYAPVESDQYYARLKQAGVASQHNCGETAAYLSAQR